MNGIIVIDKPENYTSFDIIAILRNKLEQKKIGHMGTLDPLATGVLPILLGETAKFQIFCENNNKKYSASLSFGVRTDTLDSTGKVLENCKTNIKEVDFKSVLYNFRGEIKQIPPMFSAIKKNGKKLCDLARRGIEVERDERKVTIESLDLIEFDIENQTAKIEVLCSKGTYIRTLCADIGDALGCGAIMTSLRRNESNGFNLSQSVALKAIENLQKEDIARKYILPTETLFEKLPSLNVTQQQAARFRNGGNLYIERLNLPKNVKNLQRYKIFSYDTFIGLGEIHKETTELKILKCHSGEA